jgi:hypothetical protein
MSPHRYFASGDTNVESGPYSAARGGGQANGIVRQAGEQPAGLVTDDQGVEMIAPI